MDSTVRVPVSGEKMGRFKFNKKIAAVVLIVAVTIAISAIYYLHEPAKEGAFYSKKIFPRQTYFAWDGNPPPSGYVFHAIYYDMYVNGSIVYGSGTNESSWTCPEYVYGQESNSSYKVDYAEAWTYGSVASPPP